MSDILNQRLWRSWQNSMLNQLLMDLGFWPYCSPADRPTNNSTTESAMQGELGQAMKSVKPHDPCEITWSGSFTQAEGDGVSDAGKE